MSILVGKETMVVVQGLGSAGKFHAAQCREYGTKVVAAVKPGATTGDIGAAIQTYAEAERCSVVRDFCGHGLGRVFHDRPNILHYGEPGEGLQLKPGMLFTIEPMINLGKPHVKILSDGWTAVTRDRSLSAQFEHTVGVTDTGCQVFTVSPGKLDHPPYRR